MAKRGGARKGAGRPKTSIALPTEIAGRVLARIPELGLIGQNRKPIRNAEDFALDLLSPASALRVVEDHFKNLVERNWGKAVQKSDDIGFDPDKPLRVIVEHIGRPAHPAAAEAK